MNPDSPRDLIVIGASAGGVQTLQRLVADLPPDLPASVLIVMHMMSSGPSYLDVILSRVARLPVTRARDGEQLEHGHVYVAPPSVHTLLAGDSIQLSDRAPENRYRPSIDQFFLSAARTHGRRTIGVVLTGTLSDGTEGLRLIKAHGGAVVVQDPDDATFGDMPRNAIEQVEPDRIVPLDELGGVLCELLGVARLADGIPQPFKTPILGPPRKPSEMSTLLLTCPTCGGVLTEHADDGVVHFACQTGHSYTPESLVDQQHADLETTLWQAVRTLRERAELLRRIATKIPQSAASAEHAALNERATAAAVHAAEISEMILSHRSRAGTATTEARR